MKILFCDFLFERGNRHIDSRVIDILAEDNSVYLLANEDFITCEIKNRDKIVFLGNKYSNPSKGAIKSKVQVLQRMLLAAQISREIKPDVIYVSVYETRVFPIGLLAFKDKSSIAVVENNNIDLLSNRIHRMMYQLFANKVHHIVYEPYFGEYLVNTMAVHENLVHVVPHLQYRNEGHSAPAAIGLEDTAACICISASNDEEFIRKFVDKEIREHILEKNKIRCRIKSKETSYNGNYLVVDNQFIPTNEYNKLYDNCKVVLIPFPLKYKYRMSGSVVDAISHHKKIIATNFQLAMHYRCEYGEIIEVVNNVDEMFETIIQCCSKKEEETLSFDKFEYDHSEEKLKESLRKMLYCCKRK